MLRTRCPACDTAFRITAEQLKQASGQVRCGRCSHIFPAFVHLEEGEREPDAHGIGSYSPPTGEDAESPDELSETNELEALCVDEGSSDGSDAPANPEPESEPVMVQVLGRIVDSDSRSESGESSESVAEQAAVEDVESSSLVATTDPSEPLDFPLPVDDWQAFYEAENLVDGEPEAHDSTFETAVIQDDVAADDDHHTAIQPEPAGEFATGVEAEGWEDITDVDPQAQAAADLPAAGFQVDSNDQGHMSDLEQAPANVPPQFAEETPLLSKQLVTGDSPAKKTLWWRAGAMLLAVALLVQVAHHYRATLAAIDGIGPLVRELYDALNMELTPDWDVQQYEIDEWIATITADKDGQDSLIITATLSNRGPRPQPHPYVRLDLKDRWDEVVGSRVFKPREYLSVPPQPGALMVSGTKVPAELTVADPGDDAYAFELDVCVPSGSEKLRCANEAIF